MLKCPQSFKNIACSAENKRHGQIVESLSLQQIEKLFHQDGPDVC